MGGYARLDQPLLLKMKELLVGGHAQSIWAAAEAVQHEAGKSMRGTGGRESRTRRLNDRYREHAAMNGWPVDPPFRSI